MTEEQETIYMKYRINHDEINKQSLKVWRQLYTETQLAIAMLREHFTGEKSDGGTA